MGVSGPFLFEDFLQTKSSAHLMHRCFGGLSIRRCSGSCEYFVNGTYAFLLMFEKQLPRSRD
jgi:hypothetical protein